MSAEAKSNKKKRNFKVPLSALEHRRLNIEKKTRKKYERQKRRWGQDRAAGAVGGATEPGETGKDSSHGTGVHASKGSGVSQGSGSFYEKVFSDSFDIVDEADTEDPRVLLRKRKRARNGQSEGGRAKRRKVDHSDTRDGDESDEGTRIEEPATLEEEQDDIEDKGPEHEVGTVDEKGEGTKSDEVSPLSKAEKRRRKKEEQQKRDDRMYLPFKKARREYERKRQEQEQRRREVEERHARREESARERERVKRLYNKKTKRGQIAMSARASVLLEKVKKSMENGGASSG